MTDIKTLAMNVDSGDKAYGVFRDAGIIEVSEYRNIVECYNLDGWAGIYPERQEFPFLDNCELGG